MSSLELRLAQQEAADALLSRDPFALLAGMLLDQQFPMERAFAGPQAIVDRLGLQRLDPVTIAGLDPEAFAAVLARPPAVHRFPGSMAGRLQALAGAVLERVGGDTERLWRDAATGAELVDRLAALPGFGDQKARIFTALLGKQLDVTPPGWREAAGGYGEEGVFRSVADVTGPESLQRVRETKRAAKVAARSARSAGG